MQETVNAKEYSDNFSDFYNEEGKLLKDTGIAFLMLPVILVLLFGIPGNVNAQTLERIRQGSETLTTGLDPQLLYKKIDFRDPKLSLKRFRKAIKKHGIQNPEFQQFFETVITNGVYIDFQAIQKVANQPASFSFLQKQIELYVPQTITNSITTGNLGNNVTLLSNNLNLSPKLLLRGGFLGWLGMKGVKKAIQLAKKLNEEAREAEESFTKSLPLPGPIKHHFLVSILVFVAAWIYTHGGKPLPAPIKQSFKKIFPPEKRTWTQFFQEGLEKSFNIIIKNYILFALLVFLFIYRNKLLKVLLPERKEGATVLETFSDIYKMGNEALAEAWNKTINISQEVSKTLLMSNKDYQARERQVSDKNERQAANLQKVIEQKTQIIHDLDVKIKTGNLKLETCNNAVNAYKTTFDGISLRTRAYEGFSNFLVQKWNAIKGISMNTSSLPSIPQLLLEMKDQYLKEGYGPEYILTQADLNSPYLTPPEIVSTKKDEFQPENYNLEAIENKAAETFPVPKDIPEHKPTPENPKNTNSGQSQKKDYSFLEIYSKKKN
ncbi:MAG: hypothetical protein RLY98_1480 [Bacteroidota bacterium]|jgi:hypothetical protein